MKPKSLEAGIWASSLGFGPQGWDMGFKAEIWAWRWEGGTEKEKEKEEKEKEEEKIPLCESIGHRSLRGRFPAPPSTSTTTY